MEREPDYPAGPFLGYLRERAAFARDAWRGFVDTDAPPERVRFRIFLPDSRATPFALVLYDVDREIRRATTISENEFVAPPNPRKTVARTFPPVNLKDGGLSVETAEVGSIDVVLAAFGAVEQAVLSDPVRLALTLRELLGWTGRITIRVKRALGGEQRSIVNEGDSFRVETRDSGVSITDVPEGTRLMVEHELVDGTLTRIQIDRS